MKNKIRLPLPETRKEAEEQRRKKRRRIDDDGGGVEITTCPRFMGVGCCFPIFILLFILNFKLNDTEGVTKYDAISYSAICWHAPCVICLLFFFFLTKSNNNNIFSLCCRRLICANVRLVLCVPLMYNRNSTMYNLPIFFLLGGN